MAARVAKMAQALPTAASACVALGGNAASTYNWQLGTYNADADWYFEDFLLGPQLVDPADRDSAQFIGTCRPGSAVLTTLSMMGWVAGRKRWSSRRRPGPPMQIRPLQRQCGQWHAGGLRDPGHPRQTSAYYPLLDQPGSGARNSVYRNQWAAALASAFGTNGSCPIPYSTLTSCHLYDMDNENDIWSGTHSDSQPSPSGYGGLVSVSQGGERI